MTAQPFGDCEIDPEFPGGGAWGIPMFAFERDADAPRALQGANFRSRFGTPLVVRFCPPDGPPWLGYFEAGGHEGTPRGVFATGDREVACVVAEGQAYMVDVSDPHRGLTVELWPVMSIATLPSAGLVILGDFIQLVALCGMRLAWTSPRLCMDDLELIEANEDDVRCRGAFPEGVRTFSVDVRSGMPRDVEPFDWSHQGFKPGARSAVRAAASRIAGIVGRRRGGG